ncbi:MAG: tripartite tricarboxylate transporter TctB family protein [bacterium]
MGRDGIIGLLLLALSAWLYAHARDIPRPPLLPLGPDFYPRLLLGIVAALSVALMMSDVRTRRQRGQAPVSPAAPEPSGTHPQAGTRRVGTPPAGLMVWIRQHPQVLWTYFLFGVYAVLIPVLGFRIATAGFVALLVWALGQKTLRQVPVAIATGLVTALLTHAVFEVYLRILLPRGRLL